jgi:hypothetical protein
VQGWSASKPSLQGEQGLQGSDTAGIGAAGDSGAQSASTIDFGNEPDSDTGEGGSWVG